MGTPIPGGREGNMSADYQFATALNSPSQPEHKLLYKGPRKGRKWFSQRVKASLTELTTGFRIRKGLN